MDYKTFFNELEEQYRINNINFKWNWDDAQKSFNAKKIYVLTKKDISEGAIFESNCTTIAGDDFNSAPTRYINLFFAENNEELLSFIVFFLVNQKAKIPDSIHNRMVLINKNHWSDCYFHLLKGELISNSI